MEAFDNGFSPSNIKSGCQVDECSYSSFVVFKAIGDILCKPSEVVLGGVVGSEPCLGGMDVGFNSGPYEEQNDSFCEFGNTRGEGDGSIVVGLRERFALFGDRDDCCRLPGMWNFTFRYCAVDEMHKESNVIVGEILEDKIRNVVSSRGTFGVQMENYGLQSRKGDGGSSITFHVGTADGFSGRDYDVCAIFFGNMVVLRTNGVGFDKFFRDVFIFAEGFPRAGCNGTGFVDMSPV